MEFSNVIEATGLMEKSKGWVYLDILKLNIPKGFSTVIIGDNGAGKSTLLRILSGVRSEHTGTITYFNEEKKVNKAKSHIGYVSSNNFFLEKWTVKSFAKSSKILYDNFSNEKFEKYCQEFGIVDNTMKIVDLSDGIRMKLALAAALSRETKLLILDEPASPLDPVSRDNLCSIMGQYIAEGNGEKSIIFSSHNVPDMEHIIDYAIIMEGGKIIESGFVDDLKEEYALVRGNLKHIGNADKFLCGLNKTSMEFEGICLADDVKEFDDMDVVIERPTLSQISIALLKEAKNPLSSILKKRQEASQNKLVSNTVTTAKANAIVNDMPQEKVLTGIERHKANLIDIYSEGYFALQLGNEVLKRLNKAKKWGIFDILGGGFFVGQGKYKHIREAEGFMVEFNLQLSRYKDKMTDFKTDIQQGNVVDWVHEPLDIAIVRLIDYLDGFDLADLIDISIFDFYAQSKINKAIDNVTEICDSLQASVSDVKASIDAIDQELEETND